MPDSIFWALTGVTIIAVGMFKRKESIKLRKWSEAEQVHDDLLSKLLELREDPTMSDLKWREWIPIFEMADRECARHNYYNTDFNRLADFARREIESV